MKVLHVLDHYKPASDGYVFRSNYILKHQKPFGVEPVILTSPRHGVVQREVDEYDGIRVYRTPYREYAVPFVREFLLMDVLAKRLEEVITQEKPDLIHAHSPSLNGWPAARVGRKHGIPTVYEIRAFWEDAAVENGSFTEFSMKYKISRKVETLLMGRVDHVFTICKGLRDEILARGISSGKVGVIPNCVDFGQFQPLPYDQEMAESLGLSGKFIFGFIGSHYHFEGLDVLIEAFARMADRKPEARLLIVGDGNAFDEWKGLATKLGLEGKIIFTGRVPHEEVNRYYSIVDALVYPRKSMRLTELVTPLKPLEAMAMKKVVIGSDVGGISELVTNGETGFLFRAGDVQHLESILVSVLEGKDSLGHIAETAHKHVLIRHDWNGAVGEYLPIYHHLLAQNVARLGEVA
ncbi:MAG: glycosyltransferase, exosortase A system-associated [Desulfuromonadales bacterium]|nr:glycosyltransferase, exosortase A system-associated [Desulfuromonadales bacterium]